MVAINECLIPSLRLEEIASDGSTLTNPAADSRRLFLGEDGLLHLRDSAGTVTDIGGSGSDVVQVASGAGSIRIPGLSGSPDIPPGSPHADDDEFDATDTSDPMTGWTTLGTPTTHDINSTVLSHYYVKRNAAAGTKLDGIYKTPPSFTWTATCKVSDASVHADFMKAGLFIVEAGPGKIEALQVESNGSYGRPMVEAYTNRTTYASAPYGGPGGIGVPIYLRITARSSTDIDWLWSHNGLVWNKVVAARNPGFTIAGVGLMINGENPTYDMAAAFDWIRFS